MLPFELKYRRREKKSFDTNAYAESINIKPVPQTPLKLVKKKKTRNSAVAEIHPVLTILMRINQLPNER